VPRDLLVEALMSRMAEKEGLKVASEDTRAYVADHATQHLTMACNALGSHIDRRCVMS